MAAKRRRRPRAIVKAWLRKQSWGLISPAEQAEFLIRYDGVPALHRLWSSGTLEQIAFMLAVAALIDTLDPDGRHLAAAGVVVDRASPQARQRRTAARELRTAARLAAKHGAHGAAADLRRRAAVRADGIVARYPKRPVTADNALVYALAGALEVLPGGLHARYRLVAEIVTQWTGRPISWRQVKNRLTKARSRRPVSLRRATIWTTQLGNMLRTHVLPLTRTGSPSAMRIEQLVRHPDVGCRFAVPKTTTGGRIMAAELRKRGNVRFTR